MIDDDDKDALAAEYVLGTLDAEERGQVEARVTIDAGFAAVVRQWERRLGELNVMVEAVEPPPELWDKIKAEIGEAAPAQDIGGIVPDKEEFTFPPLDRTDEDLPPDEKAPSLSSEPDPASLLLSPSAEEPAPAPPPALAPPPRVSAASRPAPRIERSADVIVLARRVRRWRRMSGALAAIAALLAIFVAVTQLAPGLIPLGRFTPSQLVARSAEPAKAPQDRLVAALQQEPVGPAFLLTVDPQSRTMTVRRVSAVPDAARSYELWLISSKFPNPRSLGVVGKDEFTSRPIPANFDADTVRAARYAISLEPAGGSPSGVPTGPILFTGRLVEALPAAAPPPQQPKT